MRWRRSPSETLPQELAPPVSPLVDPPHRAQPSRIAPASLSTSVAMNANFAQFPASAAAFYRYSAAFMTQSFGLREKQRCCYPSKRCQNPRVLKRNGELHRLCEYHRMKANVNQRRLEQRRRQRNSSMSSQDAGLVEREREKEQVFANTAPIQLHKRERVQTNCVAKEPQQQSAQQQQQQQRQRIQLNVQPRPQYKAEDRQRSQRFSLPNLSSADLPSPSGNDLNEADMHFLDEFLSETDIDLPPLTAEEAELGNMASTFRFFDASSDTRMSI
jgi:hypothetical protein